MKPHPCRRAAARAIALVAFAISAPPALAHGTAHPDTAAAEMIETAFGRTGNPRRVVRTIEVGLHDSMRFDPAAITVRQGDTIRLRVRNAGRVLHELVIGTEDELARHAALMRANPDMEHDAPYMAHVLPGQRGEIVWQFTQAGRFKFGCLVPGHFEAGMVGTVTVLPR
jgi:uncharacterized cupredoxin-like copper-binding protein